MSNLKRFKVVCKMTDDDEDLIAVEMIYQAESIEVITNALDSEPDVLSIEEIE